MLRVVFLALLLAAIGLSAKLFIWPEQHPAGRSDAVVVLAGSKKRLAKGLELMQRGLAPVLVISDGLAPGWPTANRLCRLGSKSFEVICFRPDPYSTRGEAERVTRMAKNRGWRTVTVVTSTFHLTRARMLFKRCLKARTQFVGADYPLARLPQFVVSEWVKLAYSETLKRGC